MTSLVPADIASMLRERARHHVLQMQRIDPIHPTQMQHLSAEKVGTFGMNWHMSTVGNKAHQETAQRYSRWANSFLSYSTVQKARVEGLKLIEDELVRLQNQGPGGLKFGKWGFTEWVLHEKEEDDPFPGEANKVGYHLLFQETLLQVGPNITQGQINEHFRKLLQNVHQPGRGIVERYRDGDGIVDYEVSYTVNYDDELNQFQKVKRLEALPSHVSVAMMNISRVNIAIRETFNTEITWLNTLVQQVKRL